MALFTDGPAPTIDDLVSEDSGLLETAGTVGVNVTAKLQLAMSEVRSELETWLMRPQPLYGQPWIHSPRVEQVVITPDLMRWEKMQALSMVYRDAYFTQLIDRYQGKWDEYAKLTRYARDQFVANGVGLVYDPLPKAPLPVLGSQSSVSQPAGGTFYACITWVNAAGQEGAASNAESIVVPDGQEMTVMATDMPANAIGFNVYVGTVLAMMTLQNSVPLAPGGMFTYVPGASSSNRIAGTGQKPDYVKPLPRTILRG